MTDRQIDRQVYLYSAYEFNRVTKRQAADGPSSIELSWQYLRRSTDERGHAVHHTERPALCVQHDASRGSVCRCSFLPAEARRFRCSQATAPRDSAATRPCPAAQQQRRLDATRSLSVAHRTRLPTRLSPLPPADYC